MSFGGIELFGGAVSAPPTRGRGIAKSSEGIGTEVSTLRVSDAARATVYRGAGGEPQARLSSVSGLYCEQGLQVRWQRRKKLRRLRVVRPALDAANQRGGGAGVRAIAKLPLPSPGLRPTISQRERVIAGMWRVSAGVCATAEPALVRGLGGRQAAHCRLAPSLQPCQVA